MATATAALEKKNHEHKSSSAADQMAELDRQMEVLKQKKLELSQASIHEQKLKVADARKALQAEEAKLAELTGVPVGEPKTKVRRERRPSITDDALKDQLLKVMANHGKEGMNAAQLAEKLHQDSPRIRKFLKENPKVLNRTGAAAGTKYFLH